MRGHWEYLKYVLCHKWHVGLELLKAGMVLRAILHDWDKLLPSMFFPYSRYFYLPDGSQRPRRDATGHYKPTGTGDDAFDRAWLEHANRSRHHWQFWIMPDGDGGHVLPMDPKDVAEMVCDWIGAGRAQGKPDVGAWWIANGNRMLLHSRTRDDVLDELQLHGFLDR